MYSTRPRPRGAAHREELPDLGEHVIKMTGLTPALAGEGIAVHRVARPHHRMAGVADRRQQAWEDGRRPPGAETGDEREATGRPIRVERGAQADHVGGGGVRPDLGGYWVRQS